MKRRSFIKNTTLSVIAVSASGFITFDGDHYIGECETTTDILGPFYRPGSPVRTNLLIKGGIGEPVELSGHVRQKDCVTPFKNAKVEIWHCDGKGVYDNSSSDFRYRGTTYSDEKGFYSFQTILPVPYDAGPNLTRPAHFHMMITAAGYKPLVTQLYFNGDAHIKNDPWASAEKAKRRILNVQRKSGTTKVTYDVGMSQILKLDGATLDRLVGKYAVPGNPKKTLELFKYENILWAKNEAFGDKFEYVGNNTFQEENNPQGFYWTLQFDISASGPIQIRESYTELDKSKKEFVYLKEK